MKFTVLKENFFKGLNVVGKAINSRTSMPILSNVLIKTEKGRLSMTASGLQLSITAKIGAKVDSDGAIAVPARLLAEFVSQVSGEKIDAELKGSIFKVNTDKSSASFAGADAGEFPTIDLVDKGLEVELSAKEFTQVLQLVGFTVASDEGRPVLTGIYCKAEGSSIIFAGTDGFRMAEYKMKLGKSVSEKIEFIVPARSFIEVGRAFVTEDEKLTLVVDPERNLVAMKAADMEAPFRIIDGEYPDYQSIIPAEFSSEVHISKSEFENGIKLANIFSRESGNMVKLVVKKGSVESISQPTETGSSSNEMSAEVTGEEVEIAFNAKYLLEFLANATEDDLVFKISEPLKPGLFKFEGKDHYLYIVMPMKANW